MDKAVEIEVVKRLEECLKLLGMSQCVFIFSREGKDFTSGIMSISTTPITLLGYAKYLEHAANGQMAQQFLQAHVNQALSDIKKDIEEIGKQDTPSPKDSVIH